MPDYWHCAGLGRAFPLRRLAIRTHSISMLSNFKVRARVCSFVCLFVGCVSSSEGLRYVGPACGRAHESPVSASACACACPRRCVRVSARAPPTQDLARKRLRETARPNYYLHMWGEAKYFQVISLEHPPPRTGPGPVVPLPASTPAARSAVRGIPASSHSPLVGFPLGCTMPRRRGRPTDRRPRPDPPARVPDSISGGGRAAGYI